MRTLILILLLTSCTPVTQHQREGFTESAGLNDSSSQAIDKCHEFVYSVGVQGVQVDPNRVMAWCLWRAGVSI